MPRAGLSAESVTREAARIVDAEGLGALSLARLAQSLGVAAPSLYKHVKGLDDLVARVVDLTASAFADALAEASVGRSGKDALQAIASAYRSFARTHPGTYPLIQRSPHRRAFRGRGGADGATKASPSGKGEASGKTLPSETARPSGAACPPPTIDASERIVQIAGAALIGYGIPKDSLVDAVRFVRSALHGFIDLELSGGFGERRSAEASFSVAVDLLDEALARLGRA